MRQQDLEKKKTYISVPKPLNWGKRMTLAGRIHSGVAAYNKQPSVNRVEEEDSGVGKGMQNDANSAFEIYCLSNGNNYNCLLEFLWE